MTEFTMADTPELPPYFVGNIQKKVLGILAELYMHSKITMGVHLYARMEVYACECVEQRLNEQTGPITERDFALAQTRAIIDTLTAYPLLAAKGTI